MSLNRAWMFGAALGACIGLTGRAEAGVLTYTYTGAIQQYNVSTTGTYHLIVAGAEGGLGHAMVAGLGAVISGDYLLQAGTVLQIVVGGQGVSSTANNSGEGAGGGGSFVFVTGATLPLIVAGGGGGGGVYTNIYGGDSNGQAGTSGTSGDGPYAGAGGTGGHGGSGGNFPAFQGQNGGGGAGWLSDGTAGAGPYSGQGGSGPPSFAGGAGPGIIAFAGGFGGGGGAGYSSGGGGGGYSGGGGVGGYGVGGGGGGSFYDSLFTNVVATSGANTGNGQVTINLLGGAATAVPEPSTIITASLGILGVIALARNRRVTSV